MRVLVTGAAGILSLRVFFFWVSYWVALCLFMCFVDLVVVCGCCEWMRLPVGGVQGRFVVGFVFRWVVGVRVNLVGDLVGEAFCLICFEN